MTVEEEGWERAHRWTSLRGFFLLIRPQVDSKTGDVQIPSSGLSVSLQTLTCSNSDQYFELLLKSNLVLLLHLSSGEQQWGLTTA